MLVRFLLLVSIVYLIYRIFKVLIFNGRPRAGQNPVQGKNRNRALDLSKMHVEDAKFEEIDEKRKNGK